MGKALQLKKDLYTYLLADATVSGLIGDRLYAGRAGQKPVAPYVVHTNASGREEFDHDGPTGLEEFRMQFSIFAATALSCEEIRDAIKDRINGYRGTMGATGVGWIFFDNDVDAYEDDTELKHKAIDFRIMLQ